MFDRLEHIEARYAELERALASPEIMQDSGKYQKTAKAHSELAPMVAKFREYRDLKKGVAETRDMLAQESDPEMKQMAQDELHSVEQDLKVLLIPKDPADERNVILEIRAGTGGDEASLFAAELFRMYSRYAEARRWRIEIMSQTVTGIGGYKEVIAMIEGRGAYSKLKYEGGVH